MSRPTSGYVRMHRRIIDHWIMSDPLAFTMFMTFIMWAMRKDGKTLLKKQLVTLKRGQLATSWNELAERWSVDRKTIKAKILMLKNDSMLDYAADQSGTIITILNYDKYQSPSDDDWTSERTDERTVERTNERTVERTHMEKERKRERENYIFRKNARAPRRAKTEGGISPSALAKATTSRAVAILRSQIRNGVDPRTPEAAAAALAELGTDSRDLLLKKYPTWNDFAVTWADQHERGYCQAFERELKADLGAIAKVGSSRQQDAT